MINRVAGLGQGTDRQPCGALPWSDGPHRLWSLWDMIQAIGVELFRLSEQLRSLDDNLAQLEVMVQNPPEGNRGEIKQIGRDTSCSNIWSSRRS